MKKFFDSMTQLYYYYIVYIQNEYVAWSMSANIVFKEMTQISTEKFICSLDRMAKNNFFSKSFSSVCVGIY